MQVVICEKIHHEGSNPLQRIAESPGEMLPAGFVAYAPAIASEWWRAKFRERPGLI